jgi:hypothetical protein
MDRNIEDFGFIGGLARGKEADHLSACCTDQEQGGRRRR